MNKQRARGGFCRFGNFVWIDQGVQELCLNLALIESVKLRDDGFTDGEPWTIHVTSSTSAWDFYFATEAEARNLMRCIVGDEFSADPSASKE